MMGWVTLPRFYLIFRLQQRGIGWLAYLLYQNLTAYAHRPK